MTTPSTTPARSTRRRALLLAMTLMLMAFGAVLTPTVAEAGSGDKCVTYHFEYTDGHVDSDTECSSPSTPGMNLTEGLHVSSLHISCSDSFSTEVREGDDLIGYTSSGGSDLDGHVIAVDDGARSGASPRTGPGATGSTVVTSGPPPRRPTPSPSARVR